MSKIHKDMTIHEVLTLCPDAAPVFLSLGMHCLGCPMSRNETVEQAAAAHGADAGELVAKLNAVAGV
ncbi:MAG: DUF1858 domain-containing protein [Firmicutes bacterium]|nr:DUF1858 domain-containing protein [Bacillota bacterium]